MSIRVHSWLIPRKEKQRREDLPLGAVFSTNPSCLGLFHRHSELDVAVLQVDAERVGVARRQVRGGHVEDPEATGPAEGNVRDIIDAYFVYVINRTPHRAQQGYRAVAKNRALALLALEDVSIF